MDKRITDGNKLIAEFIDYEKEEIDDEINRFYVNDHIVCVEDIDYWESSEEDWTSWLEPNQMLFHSSWDWLIPVINKITSMEEYFEYKEYTSSAFSEGGIHINTKYIGITWEQVVEFIKWYNEKIK